VTSYLIDSDRLIDHLHDEMDAVALLERLAEDGIALSIISYIEIYQGIYRAPDRTTMEGKLDALMASLRLMPVTLEIARRCAEIREDLHRRGRGTRSRALDLIIASTALEHDLTLVTRNRADYSDIPGLLLYSDG
jgi:tRNA(fMet)-specific endonuclease VapC